VLRIYRVVFSFLYSSGRTSGFALLAMLLAFFIVPSNAYAKDDIEIDPVDVKFFKETTGEHLEYTQALEKLRLEGKRTERGVLNFGLSAAPVWLQFQIHNPALAEEKYLQIETSWLDKIELYFIYQGEVIQVEVAGDTLPFTQERNNRFFSFPFNLASGDTTVLLRVETSDPQLLPIYVLSKEEMLQRKINYGYQYGIIYGFLLALLVYNLLLYFSLNSRRYLFYSLYMASFILLNVAYTGHGFKWLWSDWPAVQNFIIPILMLVYVQTGLLFGRVFLRLKTKSPRLDKVFIYFNWLIFGLTLVCIILDDIETLLLAAFASVVPFALLMIVAGAKCCLQGVKEASFFLGGAVFAMLSAVITAFTVSGLVEYRHIGFHAVEYGMLLEAVLFALALAYQFRVLKDEKLAAQRLADRDQLTGLYNRRGFYKVIDPLLKTAKSNQKELCLIALDIDHFKQINDQYGHSHGDLVLLNLAEVLQQELRHEDVTVRWGGEEFLILLPDTSYDDAIALSERLIGIISNQAVSSQGVSVQYTVSIGISQLDEVEHSFTRLLNEADSLLYEAKEQGRNRVCYRTELNGELLS